jgi:hypothetical protein
MTHPEFRCRATRGSAAFTALAGALETSRRWSSYDPLTADGGSSEDGER